MTRTVLGVSAAAMLLLTAGCGSEGENDGDDRSGGGTVTVVASTNVWGDVAAHVGGDLVDVVSVIDDPSQDPHEFEADSETLLDVSDADLIIENGGGFDDFVDTMIDSTETDAPVINAFETSGKEADAPEGEEVNEHVWYDLPTVAKVADEIAAQLGEVDPDNADTYTENAEELTGAIDDLVSRTEELRPEVEGTPVAVTEPLPAYLADALGLVDETPEAFAEAIEEGEDVPVSVLQDTLDLFGTNGVQLLFYNEQTTTPTTEKVRDAADAAAVPVVPVSEILPPDTDYLEWMGDNIDAIGSALGATS